MTSGYATLGGVNGSPDWVMLGTPQADGSFVVFASNTLDQAQLQRVSQRGFRGYHLVVGLGDVVAARGSDYQDALQQLLTFWSPTGAPQRVEPRSIDTRRKELPPA